MKIYKFGHLWWKKYMFVLESELEVKDMIRFCNELKTIGLRGIVTTAK